MSSTWIVYVGLSLLIAAFWGAIALMVIPQWWLFAGVVAFFGTLGILGFNYGAHEYDDRSDTNR